MNARLTYSAATDAAEADLIESAQAGDSAAMLALMEKYDRAIRRAVYAERKAEDEDAEQDVRLRFIEGVLAHDVARYPSLQPRVAAMLGDRETAGDTFNIPPSTLRLYRAILKAADGDVATARELAPTAAWVAMTPETFDSITRALDTSTIDETSHNDEGAAHSAPVARSLWDEPSSPFSAYDDEQAVAGAMSHLTDTQADIVRRAFGWGGEPASDAAIAADLGMSRQAVQRARVAALAVLADNLAL